MSILNTFYVLFETNARKAAADEKVLEKQTDDVARSLSHAERAAYKTGEGLGLLVRNVVAATAAYVTFAAVSGAVRAAGDRAGEIADLSQFAEGLDLTTTKLDAFGRVAKTSGSSAESAFTGLTMVSKNIGEAIDDGTSEQAKLFAKLGVNIRDTSGHARNALDVLLDIADKTAAMDKAEAINTVKKLGIRDNTLVSLILQGKALREMTGEQERNGAVTEGQVKAAKALDDTLDGLELEYESLKNRLVEYVAGGLIWAIEKSKEFAHWLGEHTDLIKGTLAPAVILITALTARWALATLAATWPFILLAGAVAAVSAVVGLLYDDFKTWREGGKSAIGEVMGPWEDFNRELDQTVERLRVIWEILKSIGSAPGRLIDWIGDKVSGGGSVRDNSPAGGWRGAVGSGQNLLAGAASSRLGPQTSTSVTMGGRGPLRSVQAPIGPITVHTQATDAEGTGRAVGKHLQSHMSQAVNNADDGIDR